MNHPLSENSPPRNLISLHAEMARVSGLNTADVPLAQVIEFAKTLKLSYVITVGLVMVFSDEIEPAIQAWKHKTQLALISKQNQRKASSIRMTEKNRNKAEAKPLVQTKPQPTVQDSGSQVATTTNSAQPRRPRGRQKKNHLRTRGTPELLHKVSIQLHKTPLTSHSNGGKRTNTKRKATKHSLTIKPEIPLRKSIAVFGLGNPCIGPGGDFFDNERDFLHLWLTFPNKLHSITQTLHK